MTVITDEPSVSLASNSINSVNCFISMPIMLRCVHAISLSTQNTVYPAKQRVLNINITALPCPGQASIQFSIPREEQQYWRLFSERDVHPQLKLITFTHKLNNRGIPSSSRLIAVHANLLNPPIQQSQSARQIAIVQARDRKSDTGLS